VGSDAGRFRRMGSGNADHRHEVNVRAAGGSTERSWCGGTGEALQAVLDDVPTWAVAAAVRCWYRDYSGENELGQPYYYHWRPRLRNLRRVSLVKKWRVQQRAQTPRKLLVAEPLNRSFPLVAALCTLKTRPIAKRFQLVRSNGRP
jgi:hypothetical protein